MLHIDGGIMSIEVDNRFISMPKMMKVVSCLIFLNYSSSESLPSSGHLSDSSSERVRVPQIIAT